MVLVVAVTIGYFFNEDTAFRIMQVYVLLAILYVENLNGSSVRTFQPIYIVYFPFSV